MEDLMNPEDIIVGNRISGDSVTRELGSCFEGGIAIGYKMRNLATYREIGVENKMLQIERRKVKKYQAKDITLSLLNNFYASKDSRNDIILVFSGDTLKTLLAYENFVTIKNEKQLMFFLENNNNCGIGYDKDSAEAVFQRFPNWKYLIVDFDDDSGMFMYLSEKESIYKNRIYAEIYDTLRECNVNVFRVNIPRLSDIRDENRADLHCKTKISQYIELIKSGDLQAPWYLDKITDIEPRALENTANLRNKKFGDGNRTIFMVGPCTVIGFENPEGESLGEILFAILKADKLPYKIEFIQFAGWGGEKMRLKKKYWKRLLKQMIS